MRLLRFPQFGSQFIGDQPTLSPPQETIDKILPGGGYQGHVRLFLSGLLDKLVLVEEISVQFEGAGKFTPAALPLDLFDARGEHGEDLAEGMAVDF